MKKLLLLTICLCLLAMPSWAENTSTHDLSEQTTPFLIDDEVALYDASSDTTKKIAIGNLVMPAYFVDSTESDQGAAGSGRTVKDLADTIDTNHGCIVFTHHGSATTAYYFDTSLNLGTKSNLYYVFQPGAYLAQNDGDEVLTVYSHDNVLGPKTSKMFDGAVITSANRGTASVSSWGVTGDGSTNDSTNLAIAMAATTGRLGFPGGTFILEDVATGSDTVYFGESPQTSVLKLSASATTYNILNPDTQNDIVFENLGFNLNDVNANGIGIRIDDCTNVRVTGCEFWSGTTNYYGHGLYLEGTVDQVKVEQNRFYNIRRGADVSTTSDTSNITFHGNTFKILKADAININPSAAGGSAYNWTITGNTFDTIGNDLNTAGFGVALSGNTDYITGVTISGNTFKRCDFNSIHIEEGSRDVTIGNNTILETGYGNSTAATRAAVYVAGADATCKIYRVKIIGNTIMGGADQVYGLYVGGTQDSYEVDFSHNGIYNTSSHGVHMGVTVGSICQGNTISTCGGNGINLPATADNCNVSGNYLTAITGTPIVDVSLDTRIYENEGADETLSDNGNPQHWGYTALDSSGGARAGTLGDGSVAGQVKTIAMTVAGNNWVVTVTHHSGGDAGTYTFDAVDEAIQLVWMSTEWVEILSDGLDYAP